jgi:4'-phosphopantetheinyl transferase EntD
MTTDTRFPELEQQFIVAGCDRLVAVHWALDIETVDSQSHNDMEFYTGNTARRQEFIVGRILAQRGLINLKQLPTPITCGIDREPLWPEGVVGSMTHTGKFAAAVVWLSKTGQRPAGIGIDAEQCGRRNPAIWPTVFTAPEIEYLNQQSPLARDQMATCLFSAKEAVYKAQFPLTRRFIEFEEITLRIPAPTTVDCRTDWLRIEHDIRELDPFHFSVFYYYLGTIVVTGAVALAKSSSLQNGS